MAKLEASPLFASLPKEIINTIEDFSETRKFTSGQHLFLDNSLVTHFFVILDGRFKVYKLSPEGKEQVLHFQKFGDLVAEAAIFDRENYPANCQALTEAKVLAIPKKEFINFLRTNPDFSLALLASYSKRLRGFVALIEDLSLNDVRKRLARFLLDNMDKKNKTVDTDLRKKDLAALIGTSPESLSRTLRAFTSVGWIVQDAKIIRVLDEQALLSIKE